MQVVSNNDYSTVGQIEPAINAPIQTLSPYMDHQNLVISAFSSGNATKSHMGLSAMPPVSITENTATITASNILS